MDAQARKRTLSGAKLSAPKKEKCMESPLVRYNEFDQLVCRVCDVVLTNVSLWDEHQASCKHHEGISKMKVNAAGLAQVSNASHKPTNHEVSQYMARWIYESGIPFDAVENDSFKRFIEALGLMGLGFQQPSRYELSNSLLKGEVDRTKRLLTKQEEEWNRNGCSIMIDAWSHQKRRSMMNVCVNCLEGTSFLSSKEASNDSHTGEFIFEYLDKCIEDIGPHNVIQVVTDNASNNMAARDLLIMKRRSIFWTSCAIRTIDLMLEEISALPNIRNLIKKARSFTVYLYAHHKILDLMRKFTNKQDIVKLGVTRFTTTFLTLQSLMENKYELKRMIVSDEWGKTKHAKSVKGKAVENIALNESFWFVMSICLKVFAPLFKVFRLAGGDQKPSMGFVYGEMLKAKEEIKNVFNGKEVYYRPVWDIIDTNVLGRLDSPLYTTAYLLNPYYRYHDVNHSNNAIVMNGLIECVEKMFGDDLDIQDALLNKELITYLDKKGFFGKPVALRGCSQDNTNYNPDNWWSIYGLHVPNLQRFAKRVLGLTTNSFGCERSWSTFEGIHTKKRNRHDVVYVQFNSKIFNRKKKQMESNVDALLSDEASNAQEWLVDGGEDDKIVANEDMTTTYEDIRELEDEFISDEEEEANIKLEEYELVFEDYGYGDLR